MRIGMVFALVCAIGCAGGPATRVIVGEHTYDVDDLVRRHPLERGANIRADEIDRTGGMSVHLVQVRGSEAPHRHRTHDLAVTVLRGHGVLRSGRTEQTMQEGDAAVVPRGLTHWYTNRGDRPSVALAVFVPPLDAPDSQAGGDVDSREGAR